MDEEKIQGEIIPEVSVSGRDNDFEDNVACAPLDLRCLHQLPFLRSDPLHQFRCGFIVRVLLHQLATHG